VVLVPIYFHKLPVAIMEEFHGCCDGPGLTTVRSFWSCRRYRGTRTMWRWWGLVGMALLGVLVGIGQAGTASAKEIRFIAQ